MLEMAQRNMMMTTMMMAHQKRMNSEEPGQEGKEKRLNKFWWNRIYTKEIDKMACH